MLKFLRWVKIGFWWSFFTLVAGTLVVTSVLSHNMQPAWEEISQNDNISADLPLEYKKAAHKSRASAVMVKSSQLTFWGGTSTMSGTYFVANDKHYVVTVHHGIHGPCWLIAVIHEENYYSCKKYVVLNEANDYAIIEVEEPISDRIPVRIPKDLPHGSEWKRSYSILNNIIYTGYPNTIGPLTLRGDVIGYDQNEYIYIFSHAYGGASGSGVFTRKGKYIGYIVAIDVGETELGPDVLENIVIVAPAFNIDWSVVLN